MQYLSILEYLAGAFGSRVVDRAQEGSCELTLRHIAPLEFNIGE